MTSLENKLLSECHNLEKVLTKTNETLSLINDLENELYFDGLVSGLTLHLENFYMGVERILSLIAQEIDLTVPSGGSWHLQLLKQMSLEIPSVRPAVISPETYERLNEFRGFRHVARNIYVYDLDSQRVMELASKASDCHNSFRQDLDNFIDVFF